MMGVHSSPGSANKNATRTRSKYGGGGGGGGEDSIIVADKSKLALLLGDGPIEPALPLRPVPVKPPDSTYTNPSKVRHRTAPYCGTEG